MGATEVTQTQWQAIMGSAPGHVLAHGQQPLREFRGSDLPVEQVSFYDVQEFIKKLNARSGKGLRLPTEAEWEYACREGGRKVRYCHGQDEASKSAINYDGSMTKPVASFAPNSLGLEEVG